MEQAPYAWVNLPPLAQGVLGMWRGWVPNCQRGAPRLLSLARRPRPRGRWHPLKVCSAFLLGRIVNACKSRETAQNTFFCPGCFTLSFSFFLASIAKEKETVKQPGNLAKVQTKTAKTFVTAWLLRGLLFFSCFDFLSMLISILLGPPVDESSA